MINDLTKQLDTDRAKYTAGSFQIACAITMIVLIVEPTDYFAAVTMCC